MGATKAEPPRRPEGRPASPTARQWHPGVPGAGPKCPEARGCNSSARNDHAEWQGRREVCTRTRGVYKSSQRNGASTSRNGLGYLPGAPNGSLDHARRLAGALGPALHCATGMESWKPLVNIWFAHVPDGPTPYCPLRHVPKAGPWRVDPSSPRVICDPYKVLGRHNKPRGHWGVGRTHG